MIRIKSEVNSTGQHVVDLRGRYVSENVIAKLREVSSVKHQAFNTSFTIAYHERGMLNNEAFIVFEANARKTDVDEVVDWLNVVLVPHIGSAFCVIEASPYRVKYTGDTDGLTICLEIAKETDCRFDGGGWNQPVTFHPSNSIQYNQITELLETFGVCYT